MKYDDAQDSDMHGDIVYTYAYCNTKHECNFQLITSEIGVKPMLIHFPDGVPSLPSIIGAIGHEVWHAHQAERAFSFLKRHGGVLDLSEIDPSDFKNRGALYVLSNQLLYSQVLRYRHQLCEIESIYIEGEIAKSLVG